MFGSYDVLRVFLTRVSEVSGNELRRLETEPLVVPGSKELNNDSHGDVARVKIDAQH
jgi:hypothetical protein